MGELNNTLSDEEYKVILDMINELLRDKYKRV